MSRASPPQPSMTTKAAQSSGGGGGGGGGEDEASFSSSSSSSSLYEGFSNYVRYVSDTGDAAWKYAQDTVDYASEGAQSQVTGWVSSVIYGNPSSPPLPTPHPSQDSSSSSSWWNSSSLLWGTDSGKKSMPSLEGVPATDASSSPEASSSSTTRTLGNSFWGRFPSSSSTLSTNPASSSSSSMTSYRRSPLRRYPELQWLLRNPYDNVLGRPYHVGIVGGRPSSLHAVRSLLTLVPELQQQVIPEEEEEEEEEDEEEENEAQEERKERNKTMKKHARDEAGLLIVEGTEEEDEEEDAAARAEKARNSYLGDSFLSTGEEEDVDSSTKTRRSKTSKSSRRKLKRSRRRLSSATPPAETASRLAGGTLRALRDMALDEALELRASLQFWAERWERPLLSWLEAGPWIWFSYTGYNHQTVGRKVSQLQAVLARRCAAIGEIQQHLLRAGWQRGVAQWGVLGQGGPWATVTGGDGRMMADVAWWAEQEVLRDHALQLLPHAKRVGHSEHGSSEHASEGGVEELSKAAHSTTTRIPPQQQQQRDGRLQSPRRWQSPQYHETSVMVQNTRDGGIISNEAALAAWSIDAIRVVRDQLYRAGDGGLHPLPHYEHWDDEVKHFDGVKGKQQQQQEYGHHDEDFSTKEDETGMPLGCVPLWATRVVMEEEEQDAQTLEPAPAETLAESSASMTSKEDEEKKDGRQAPIAPTDVSNDATTTAAAETRRKQPATVRISNLSLMALEVNDLLNTMERHMTMQRERRLEKLRPMARLRRLWYLVAASGPLVTYIVYKAIRGQLTQHIVTAWMQALLSKIQSIYAEHLADPLRAIYRELFTRRGRASYTDRNARMKSIATLQKMLKSWLDETYGDEMSEEERETMASSMDVSLVEDCKEASIKTIYEINTIVRTSLIEMQFIKKELMNAMGAMDELMGANEMNMKLAAMTPAFILMYGARYIFRVVRYALLKIGKSREESYASFRHLILDIERLLVMRDNPPLSEWDRGNSNNNDNNNMTTISPTTTTSVLNADDLGMLMLLVHECRQILWQDSRRFSASEIRNVSEDLAELAGERGVVSVPQQLHIVSRMCRTYSFLKVLSTGLPFNLIRQV